jgi:hypothetical protein
MSNQLITSQNQQLPYGACQISLESGKNAIVNKGSLFIEEKKCSSAVNLTGLFHSNYHLKSDNFFGITETGKIYHIYVLPNGSVGMTLIAAPKFSEIQDNSENSSTTFPSFNSSLIIYRNFYTFQNTNVLIFDTDQGMIFIGLGKIYRDGVELILENTQVIVHNFIVTSTRKKTGMEKKYLEKSCVKTRSLKSNTKTCRRMKIHITIRKLVLFDTEYTIENSCSRILFETSQDACLMYPEYEKGTLCCIATIPKGCCIDRVFGIAKERVYYRHHNGSLWIGELGERIRKLCEPDEWFGQCHTNQEQHDYDLTIQNIKIPYLAGIRHDVNPSADLFQLFGTIPEESFQNTLIIFYHIKPYFGLKYIRLILIVGTEITYPTLEYHISEPGNTTVVLKLNHNAHSKIISLERRIVVIDNQAGVFHSYTFHHGPFGYYPKEMMFRLSPNQINIDIGEDGLVLETTERDKTQTVFRFWNGHEIPIIDIEANLSLRIETNLSLY